MQNLRFWTFFIPFLLFCNTQALAAAPEVTSRVASIFISQDFLNEQLKAHMKSEMLKETKISFDPEKNQIYMRGVIHVPVEEMRAVNLDPKLGAFKYQVTIRLETTKQGHLVLEFPLSETFFYPADSTTPEQDRIIVPVQMISMALASARGYLATLSGDFSSFDRRTEKLKTSIKVLEQTLKKEKNPDIIESAKNQIEALKIQLQAVPVERKQLEKLSKEYEHIMGFTGEKELNLNQELAARKNAIIFKIQLDQFTPYLVGAELGGIRIVHDKKDGNGENYLAIDVNSTTDKSEVIPPTKNPGVRKPMKVAPALIMRINQSILESTAVTSVEVKKMPSKIENFKVQMKDDGIHVSGDFKTFMVKIPFETTVTFVSTGLDTFEARVKELEVAGLDLEFLTSFILEAIQRRLELTLHKICSFKYVGEEKARALQVTLEPKALVPAFPDLHLVEIDVRDGELLLKIGKAIDP